MDLIKQLHNSDGHSTILVVVDRPCKQAIFIPTHDTLTAQELADLFVTHVFFKHGVPSHVTSDRGSMFVLHFFRSLGKALDMRLHFTSSYHPESDGQIETAGSNSFGHGWIKKSTPIVIEDELTTPTKKKSKDKEREMGLGQQNPKPERLIDREPERLIDREPERLIDREPERLIDHELLQDMLVEGQKMRLRMSQLLQSMQEEGELQVQWALADSKCMHQAVCKEMSKWVEEELRPLIREEIRSMLTEVFGAPEEREGRPSTSPPRSSSSAPEPSTSPPRPSSSAPQPSTSPPPPSFKPPPWLSSLPPPGPSSAPPAGVAPPPQPLQLR
ncbi:hypothetical protein ACG7TL_007647 [Trametes sanguinea]